MKSQHGQAREYRIRAAAISSVGGAKQHFRRLVLYGRWSTLMALVGCSTWLEHNYRRFDIRWLPGSHYAGHRRAKKVFTGYQTNFLLTQQLMRRFRQPNSTQLT